MVTKKTPIKKQDKKPNIPMKNMKEIKDKVASVKKKITNAKIKNKTIAKDKSVKIKEVPLKVKKSKVDATVPALSLKLKRKM